MNFEGTQRFGTNGFERTVRLFQMYGRWLEMDFQTWPMERIAAGKIERGGI